MNTILNCLVQQHDWRILPFALLVSVFSLLIALCLFDRARNVARRSRRVYLIAVPLVAGLGVFLLTGKGRDTREFLSESRFELRKVVWPTRQEAIRMTWVVIVVVIILSLLLGGFDFVIQKLTQWFLGR